MKRMQEINELLNQRWVLKKQDPETYFKLKDQYQVYKKFFQEKLGYHVLINPLLVKAEKTPGEVQTWMGIQAFTQPMDYVFLCFVLMFLEELETEEQFVLAQVTDFIQQQNVDDLVIDWTQFSQRKALIKVLRFCTNEGMMMVTDGDDHRFTSSVDAVEVLYQNTGASKYFMRRFVYDISDVQKVDDFAELEWQMTNQDRGVVRRHRVYRRLLMSPVVYQTDDDDQDYDYIRRQRSVIEHDVEQYLGGDFHLHKNGAFVLMPQGMLTDGLPNRKNSSDIVLQTCHLIQKKVQAGELVRQANDVIVISYVKWKTLLQEMAERNGDGWGKQYRELSFNRLCEEINMTMKAFGMIDDEISETEIYIYPAVGKIAGDYSNQYWAKQSK